MRNFFHMIFFILFDKVMADKKANKNFKFLSTGKKNFAKALCKKCIDKMHEQQPIGP